MPTAQTAIATAGSSASSVGEDRVAERETLVEVGARDQRPGPQGVQGGLRPARRGLGVGEHRLDARGAPGVWNCWCRTRTVTARTRSSRSAAPTTASARTRSASSARPLAQQVVGQGEVRGEAPAGHGRAQSCFVGHARSPRRRGHRLRRRPRRRPHDPTDPDIRTPS